MSLVLSIVVAVSATLAVCIGQLLFGEFSLFSIGVTFLVASAGYSAVDYMRSIAKPPSSSSGSEDVSPLSGD